MSDAKADLSKPTSEPQIGDDNKPQESEVKQPKKSILISKEKEDEILQKLDELENSDQFLNKEMSLAVLAGQLETNKKYL